MPTTYPPAPPSLSGDVLSINRFLQSPTLLQRALRTIAMQRFISDRLLTGRFQVSGGAVQYQQSESIYSDRAIEAVAPGSEYPLSTTGLGTAQIASVSKWGQDSEVSDEAIKRFLFDPVQRALRKQANQVVKKVDTVSLAVIAAQITTSQAATAAWAPGTANTNPLYDIMKAVATVNALNQGYILDTLVVDDLTYAKLMNNASVLAALRREDPSNPAYTGQINELSGLKQILPTPNLPTSGTALVVDSSVLGGMADENLGGPGYTGDAAGIEVKSIRQDISDGWRLRARRITVPIVIEPLAGVVITGV